MNNFIIEQIGIDQFVTLFIEEKDGILILVDKQGNYVRDYEEES